MLRTLGVMGRVLDQQDGLGLYCHALLEHMIAARRFRYVLFLATQTHAARYAALPGCEVELVRSRSKLWWDQVAVPRAAARNGVDLLFNPKFSVPLLTRIPSVFVLQDSDWYENPGNYPWWDNLYIRLMLPLYCRKARRLLCISRFTLDGLVRRRIVPPGRAVVTHAAVGSQFSGRVDPERIAAFKARHGLPPRYVLSAARAWHTGHTGSPPYPGGNIERLVRAYQSYRRAGGTLPLVVVGHRIEAYLRERGFGDESQAGICFPGFIPNTEMHLAYQGAEFFVLTKLCESFGLPILEALATGCPAIVPRTCASPEVAGGAARLIDPRDEADIARALLELERAPAERERLRALGLARAMAFSWASTAQRTLEVLEDAAGAGIGTAAQA